MLKFRRTALFFAALTILAALILLVERGGLIAWAALLIGIALLVKIWRKPSARDLGLSLGLVIISAVAWVGSFYYVISTWESGEVVELVIDTSKGAHTARVWIMDIGASPTVYYDAEPEVAEALLAGNPLQLTRAGEVSTRIPKATRFDELPEKEANQIFEAMEAKYEGLNGGAIIYYVMLGGGRDRVVVVADLIEE